MIGYLGVPFCKTHRRWFCQSESVQDYSSHITVVKKRGACDRNNTTRHIRAYLTLIYTYRPSDRRCSRM